MTISSKLQDIVFQICDFDFQFSSYYWNQ